MTTIMTFHFQPTSLIDPRFSAEIGKTSAKTDFVPFWGEIWEGSLQLWNAEESRC